MGRLDGKIALITGGTSGIGEASVRLFAEEGATVIFVGRNAQKGQEIETEILEKGYTAHFYRCDVTKSEERKNLKEYILQEFQHLDILFNCVGVLMTSTLEDLKEDEWKEMFAVNTDSTVFMCKEFIDCLIESKGNILNMSSIDGIQGNCKGRASYMYVTTKAAVIQFTHLLATNYSDRIRVNCLCPGTTETNLFINKDYSRFLEQIPMRRVAKPIEIAKVALFLVSDDASYMTGSIVKVDGGKSLL